MGSGKLKIENWRKSGNTQQVLIEPRDVAKGVLGSTANIRLVSADSSSSAKVHVHDLAPTPIEFAGMDVRAHDFLGSITRQFRTLHLLFRRFERITSSAVKRPSHHRVSLSLLLPSYYELI